MNFDLQSGIKQAQLLVSPAARTQRLQKRISGRELDPQAEAPTFAYSVVYFTTVAVLVTLCLQAAFH